MIVILTACFLETLPEAVLIRNAMGTLLSSLDGSGVFVNVCVKMWRRQTIRVSECVCGGERKSK